MQWFWTIISYNPSHIQYNADTRCWPLTLTFVHWKGNVLSFQMHLNQRVLNIQRHHWTAHEGPSFGCHGDVPSGAKLTAHALAGDTVPVYDHARGIKTTRCIALCNSCHVRTLAEHLGSAWKWLNCMRFPWQRNGTKMRCTRWYSRCGD